MSATPSSPVSKNSSPPFELPDPDDRQVVAVAVRPGADLVVAANLEDFPDSALYRHDLAAEHPDVFLANLCSRVPVLFLQAAPRVRSRLRNPPVSRREHLAIPRRIGLSATVEEMLKHSPTP